MQLGVLQQFKGPFPAATTLPIDSNSHLKIGISVGEKDYMNFPPSSVAKTFPSSVMNQTINGLPVVINTSSIPSTIYIGRTFMYETDHVIINASISFPIGAPESTLVDIVYCARPD